MVPFLVLVSVALGARLAGQLGVRPLRAWPACVRLGLAAMFCVTAAAHFNSMRPDLVAMVPPGVPSPGLMVTVTGLCELAGAAGLLVPRTRRAAALGLIVLLLAVLPANVHAARAGVTLRGEPPTPLALRVPLQALFIGVLWWAGVRRAIGEGVRS